MTIQISIFALFGIFLSKHFQRMGRSEICFLKATRQEDDGDDDDAYDNYYYHAYDNYYYHHDDDSNDVDDDIVYLKPSGRKMITADINAIIFITGNITVIINCVGIGLRTIFGPL